MACKYLCIENFTNFVSKRAKKDNLCQKLHVEHTGHRIKF